MLHRAVVIDQLAQNPAGVLAGQNRQIDRRLGMAGPLQDPARPGPEGKNMAGLDQLLRTARPGSARMRMDSWCPVVGADARRDALGGVHADGEVRAVAFAVARHHRATSP